MRTESNLDILFVEDNPHDAELAIEALKKKNMADDIVWVQDGKEALDFLYCKGNFSERSLEDKPHIILLDLKLPRVDGLEALQHIREDNQFFNVPVVILTSSQEETDLMKGYNYGANSYIVKPVNFQKFNETVQEIGFYWMLMNQTYG